MVERKRISVTAQSAEDRRALQDIARAIEAKNAAAGPGAGGQQDSVNNVNDQAGQDAETEPAGGIEGTALRLLLDALPAGTAICVGGELRYANAGFALAFGYRSPAELIAQGGLQRIFGTLAPKLFEGNGDSPREILLKCRTESGREMAVPVGIYRHGGSEDALTLLILRPMEDLPGQDDSPELQGDLLARVSHEVRTPLNSIIGFSELLKQERFGALGHPKYLGYAEDIYQSGQYALDIINDLLDISKIKSGKFEINFTSVNLNELVHECVHLIEPQALAEKVVIRTSLEEQLSAVLADRRSLKQILLNLLTNALKFTEPGGQVIVSTLPGQDNAIVLRVRDTGVGMSQSDIARAMKPYQQLETATGRRPGTGLGLALTKALTEANRAILRLESNPGAGTSADVVFPEARVVSKRLLTSH